MFLHVQVNDCLVVDIAAYQAILNVDKGTAHIMRHVRLSCLERRKPGKAYILFLPCFLIGGLHNAREQENLEARKMLENCDELHRSSARHVSRLLYGMFAGEGPAPQMISVHIGFLTFPGSLSFPKMRNDKGGLFSILLIGFAKPQFHFFFFEKLDIYEKKNCKCQYQYYC